MYKEHIFCEEYQNLRDIVNDLLNGDEIDEEKARSLGICVDENGFCSIDHIKYTIQNIYDNDGMPSTQYDELMNDLQDLEDFNVQKVEKPKKRFFSRF